MGLTNMKWIGLVGLVTLACASEHKSQFISKEDASEMLDLPHYRVKRFWSRGDKVAKLKRKWNNKCQFNSVERWDEFKDELEETSLQEKEVDSLERCTSACYWKDQAKDFAGQAYEEKREDQEEEKQPFEPACKKCFDRVPKSAGTWPWKAKCKNKESIFVNGPF